MLIWNRCVVRRKVGEQSSVGDCSREGESREYSLERDGLYVLVAIAGASLGRAGVIATTLSSANAFPITAGPAVSYGMEGGKALSGVTVMWQVVFPLAQASHDLSRVL